MPNPALPLPANSGRMEAIAGRSDTNSPTVRQGPRPRPHAAPPVRVRTHPPYKSIHDKCPPFPAPVSRKTASPPRTPRRRHGRPSVLRRSCPQYTVKPGGIRSTQRRLRSGNPSACVRPVGSPNSARAAGPSARRGPSGSAGASSIAVWNPPCTNSLPPSRSHSGARAISARARAASAGSSCAQGAAQFRVRPHLLPGERARQPVVVVAQQEQPAPGVDQREHHRQSVRAARPVVRQVAELDHEPVGRGGIGEGRGVAVHVAHHPQPRPAAGCGPAGSCRAGRAHGRRPPPARAPARPRRSTIGAG